MLVEKDNCYYCCNFIVTRLNKKIGGGNCQIYLQTIFLWLSNSMQNDRLVHLFRNHFDLIPFADSMHHAEGSQASLVHSRDLAIRDFHGNKTHYSDEKRRMAVPAVTRTSSRADFATRVLVAERKSRRLITCDWENSFSQRKNTIPTVPHVLVVVILFAPPLLYAALIESV